MALTHGGTSFLVLMAVLVAVRMIATRRRRGGAGGGWGWGGRGAGGRSSYLNGQGGASGGSGAPSRSPGHTGIPAGWMADPSGRHDQRYWSGTEWTEHVSTGGVPGTDPPPGHPSREDG